MPPVIKVTDQPELVSTSKFPYAKFPFESFNPVQSRVFEYYDKQNNLVIATATSSGKTVIAEMIASYEIRANKKKAMYLVPMKSLAQEKYEDWTDPKHHFYDLKVSICTGDYRLTPSRQKELDQADVIIMSSEMLSHRTRSNNAEKNKWMSQIGTLIIDESHLLSVPGRW